MSHKYRQFIFKDYRLDPESRQLTLEYSYDDVLTLREVFTFNFAWQSTDPEVLDRACQLLFFMAGVSYYKAYLSPEIVAQKGTLTPTLASFLRKTYQKGLGEFFYVNQLDPSQEIPFQPTTEQELSPSQYQGAGLLIGLGGGKDSLVTTEILKDLPDTATWSAGHAKQLQPLIERIGLPHYSVERQWDRKLLELNQQDAYNGHVPISAILACAGVVTAVLAGKQSVVVSNEQSANEPTLEYRGVDINHQYSKSLEFEKDFQKLLQTMFGETLGYFSFLRPLSEVRIAEMFVRLGLFDKYQGVFSSCNKAYTQHSGGHMFWCGECPKCAFVFLALTPFIDREKLETLFHGKNLLLDPELEETYRNLLGIAGEKPLECVGEIKESRTAMRMAQQIYPELTKYEFDIPKDYDYRSTGASSMPAEMLDILNQILSPLN